jgi:hypothetical protein
VRSTSGEQRSLHFSNDPLMPATSPASILRSVRLRSHTRLAVVAGVAAVLALPAVAGGARQRVGDGTLSLRDGRGLVVVAARGTIIGRLDRGQVLVVDRRPFDTATPVVRGGRLRKLTKRRVVRSGRNIRFRLSAGSYRLRVRGRGIVINAVGRGAVTMDGDERFADTGLYSVNGDDFQPVPYERETVKLAAPPSQTGGRQRPH